MESFVIATVVTVLHAAVPAAATVAASASNFASYEAFRQEYGRASSQDSDIVSYQTRFALFEARRKAVMAHNRKPGISWIAKVNKFADYTEAEQRAMLGYRRVGEWWAGNGLSSSLLEVGPEKHVVVAESMDWRMKLKVSGGFLREQGSCGSCWAVAAAGAIEMHAELWSKPTGPLSFAQLVDCTPNKRHCGGTGGCQGATAELAFEYAQTHALMDADAYTGYGDGSGGSCKQAAARGHVFTQGFMRLPTNKVGPLLEAVATKGPVVVSADAEGWSPYSSGIFDECSRNATVNHAILLMGYGIDPSLGGKLYWLVRNSWGSSWGENGHIRVLRHESDVGEAGYCGMDNNPQEGVGCDGGPKVTPVCGMCGMLADSSFPTGVRVTSGGPAAMIRGRQTIQDMIGPSPGDRSSNNWWTFMG